MVSVTIKELDEPHILALYAVNKAPNGVPTKTHFQKIMYLALKALGRKPEEAQFRAHYYGPYSNMVDDWRNELINTGYIVKGSGSDRVRISPEVQDAVDNIKPPNSLDGFKIKEIVEFVCSLTLDELLLIVYTDDVQNKEGMPSNALRIDEIFEKRLELALRMARAEKITVARGAELADTDIRTFMALLKGQ